MRGNEKLSRRRIKSEGELIIDWIWKLCIMTLVSVVKYRRNDFCDCSII